MWRVYTTAVLLLADSLHVGASAQSMTMHFQNITGSYVPFTV